MLKGIFADVLTWEGIIILLLTNSTTVTDEELVLKLLGRTPKSPFSILTRCGDRTPQVIMADPIYFEDGMWKPFPAFLWLLCPRLKKNVSKLEEQGKIRMYSEKLQNDSKFKDDFLEGQRAMSELRLKKAKEIYGKNIPEKIFKTLQETTIAGSNYWAGVKCLHSHLAQELAFGNNPIGAEILELTGKCLPEYRCLNLSEVRNA